MNPLILLIVLVAIALAAPRYGVDSRWAPPGEPTPPRRGPTPLSDLAALVRALRHRPAPGTTDHALEVGSGTRSMTPAG